MQTSYHTKDNQAYQKVMVEINSSKEEIFAHLATTKAFRSGFRNSLLKVQNAWCLTLEMMNMQKWMYSL